MAVCACLAGWPSFDSIKNEPQCNSMGLYLESTRKSSDHLPEHVDLNCVRRADKGTVSRGLKLWLVIAVSCWATWISVIRDRSCCLTTFRSTCVGSAQPTSAYPAAQTAYVQPAHQTAYAAAAPRPAQAYDTYQPTPHAAGQYAYATRTQVQVRVRLPSWYIQRCSDPDLCVAMEEGYAGPQSEEATRFVEWHQWNFCATTRMVFVFWLFPRLSRRHSGDLTKTPSFGAGVHWKVGRKKVENNFCSIVKCLFQPAATYETNKTYYTPTAAPAAAAAAVYTVATDATFQTGKWTPQCETHRKIVGTWQTQLYPMDFRAVAVRLNL